MSVIHAPKRPELDGRLLSLLVGVGVAGVILLFRLWYVQILEAQAYSLTAEKYRWSTVEKLAPRGLIYDRKGNLLAGVQPQIVINVVPDIANKKPWIVDKLAGLLGVEPKKLRDRVRDGASRPYLPTPVFVGVPIETATRIAEAGDNLPGVSVDTMPMRHYPNTRDLAHILGYVWTPDARDVERFEKHEWPLPQYVGKQGLEWSLEEDLMGKSGTETIEVDAKRRPVRIIGRENAIPGNKVVLTLDRELQKFCNEQLATIKERFPQSGGAIVALDPRNGEVLALASYPTFDTALFKGGISLAELKLLQDNPLNPMWNRAIAGEYSPGSTFKVVTAIAAAEAGYFNPNRPFVCRGYYEAGNRKIKCLGVHGAITFRDALAKSCNAYFGDLAAHAKRVGIVQAGLDCGLGRRTGIELRGEASGTLPTDEWLMKVQRVKRIEETSWYLGNTINVGIGQGEVNATPLQMANVAALAANGGVSFVPHLVRSRFRDGVEVMTQPVECSRPSVEPSVWQVIREGMRGVIGYGTARSAAQIPGVTWAGKTGSTEAKGNKLTHSWFIGFAPFDKPEIAIAIVVEKAGHGSDVSAPMARRVVEYFLRSRKEATP